MPYKGSIFQESYVQEPSSIIHLSYKHPSRHSTLDIPRISMQSTDFITIIPKLIYTSEEQMRPTSPSFTTVIENVDPKFNVL